MRGAGPSADAPCSQTILVQVLPNAAAAGAWRNACLRAGIPAAGAARTGTTTMTLTAVALGAELLDLTGLSARLIQSHYDNNYMGALRRLGAIDAELRGIDWPAAPGFRLNGLKREALLAHNSVVLHELYFDSLGRSGPPGGALAAALARDFGSVARWQAEFTALGKALGGGSGWVLLCHSPREERLINQWAADHACAMPDAVPLLALDMYEHAYHLDYGANAGAYVDAFVAAIDWRRVAARHAVATADGLPALGADALRAALAAGDAPVVVDVRRATAFARDPQVIAGALRRLPDEVADWQAALPAGRRVLVYCAFGHHVGRGVAARLREMGHDASYLAGGLAAWRAAGGALAEGAVP